MFEHIGNTLIFAYAGAYTQRVMFGRGSRYIRARDYGFAVVFYLLLIAARAGMVFLLYPVLRKIGYGLGKREAIFVVWGGLNQRKNQSRRFSESPTAPTHWLICAQACTAPSVSPWP